jgi:hypothetical protein
MENLEKLIILALKEFVDLEYVENISQDNNYKHKIVFPKYRNGERRVSEQEIKQLFIKRIENDDSFLYSVETPTDRLYGFSGEGERSANFDLCLYDKSGKRKHLIEFKAHNAEYRNIYKDFKKLLYDVADGENGLSNYFIHVLENTNKRTIENIKNKYDKALKNLKEPPKKLPDLTIFLCSFDNKKYINKYRLDKEKRNPLSLFPAEEKEFEEKNL